MDGVNGESPRIPRSGIGRGRRRAASFLLGSRETIDRGLVVVPLADGAVYLGWRRLRSDPDAIASRIEGKDGSGRVVQITPEIVRGSTNRVDRTAKTGLTCSYRMMAFIDGNEIDASREV